MTAIAATTYPEHVPIGQVAPRSRFGDVLAGGICLLAFMGLLPTAWMSPYPATIIVGIGSLAAVMGALYVKYRGRITLNNEVAFILGMAIQYLFAPVLIRLLTSNFEYFGPGQSAERYAVKDYYGPAMLIVLLFSTVYFFTSSLIPVRLPERRIDGRLNLAYSQRTLVVMGVLTAMLWMTRAALLATGSFYHLHRSRFMVDDPRYSGWMQFDTGIGPMILAFLWGAMFVKKVPKVLVFGYTIIDFGWNFSSGSRERTLVAVLAILLTFIVYRNRIPWRTIVLMAIPGIFLLGFMDYYRYAVAQTSDVNTISLSGVKAALSVAERKSERSGLQNTVYQGLARLNDLESIAAIYTWTGSVQPYLSGETYASIPAALVPRALWPDKPKTVIPINGWYFIHEGGSSPITTMGEGYLNYGWAGVILAGVLSAIFVRMTEWILLRCMWNVAILPVYIGTLAIISRQHTQAMAVWIPTMLKMAFLAWIIHLLTRPQRVVEPTAQAQLAGDGYADELTTAAY